MKRRAFLALLLIASCSRPTPPPRSEERRLPSKLPTDVANERSSLLDVTRGATIVSRTGEAMLITSAIATIDGAIGTYWTPPPHDYPQSIVIALAAPSRIDRVGFRSLAALDAEANHVTFERSLDGANWLPLATMTTRHVSTAQWLDIAPAEAAYLRVTIPDAAYAGHDARLHSLLAHGTELAAPKNAPIDGCWSINGEAAKFAQHGARVTGVVEQNKQPLLFAGGSNGRMWRFNWIRGNDYGYTALTVSPDGKHLSALNWHEEAIPLFTAFPWFGDRGGCAATPLRDDVPILLLHRAARVSLFALQFDANGNLLADASRDELQSLISIIRGVPVPLRIIAHEFRQDSKRNKEIAEREIASVRAALADVDLARVEFVAAGSDSPRQVPESDAARAIYSSVDVEVRR
ncbi:MAG: discoidin domain-containing protein [Acidobacteria bacterium]|nr:discoidin domain-containing protein [Acidobacteriota bacterium]MBV9069205.1 discoidin domain-containing protein [Acidobacteriota bacterium]MBV9186026.1 discoidin domain-containing protein [Acidobacteriota bacterium]